MMAKMFYSLEEAADKLSMSTDEVQAMAQRGEITEVRDGDRLIFKVDQINLLAGDDDAGASGSMIPLADTGGGSGFALEDLDDDATIADPNEQTGISVFDADELEEADPAAQTQVTDVGLAGLDIDSLGSGSGLMDLTRESDDSSLGAEGLLDELYPGDTAGADDLTVGESGLFEGTVADAGGSDLDEAAAPAAAAVLAEPYDPKGSGLAGGFSLGTIIALGAAMAVMIMGLIGAPPEFVATFMGGNMLIVTGIFAGVAAVFGVLGFLVCK